MKKVKWLLAGAGDIVKSRVAAALATDAVFRSARSGLPEKVTP